MPRKRPLAAVLALLLFLLTGCSEHSTPPSQNSTAQWQPPAVSESELFVASAETGKAEAASPQRLAVEHLPNAIRLHDKVISGGLPEGDAAFAELRQLGVKTVISVDGAKPDVELARKYGMRYVHLPHGYDGVPEERGRELAKAVRDLPGPIYLHCHHGKHRSPTAAVVACVTAGMYPAGKAVEALQFAGTNPNYKGLYESAEEARALDSALLDALDADFPEIAELPPLAKAMVEVEHAHAHLQAIAAAGWKTPSDHPALDPPHEALLLREHFTELLRTDEVQQAPERFRQLTTESETDSSKLEAALREWIGHGSPDPIPDGITAAFDRVTKNCRTCHEAFRDVPLRRKGRI